MTDRNSLNVAARWDAGEAGCSGLIVGLKRQLTPLKPGDVLEVIARDEGASIDLFVWCRMTGRALLLEAPPRYLIQQRGS